MSKKNILVVDDDIDIREVISYALSSEGYNVFTAGNGEEAIELLAGSNKISETIDCIVLDLMMPRMNGEQFIKTIRSTYKEFSKIPIVVITAQGSGLTSETLKDTKKIHKPMDLDELYLAIEESFSQPK